MAKFTIKLWEVHHREGAIRARWLFSNKSAMDDFLCSRAEEWAALNQDWLPTGWETLSKARRVALWLGVVGKPSLPTTEGSWAIRQHVLPVDSSDVLGEDGKPAYQIAGLKSQRRRVRLHGGYSEMNKSNGGGIDGNEKKRV